MRRSPLLITTGVLLATVSAVVAVRYMHTYESPAAAGGSPAATQSGDPGDENAEGADPSEAPEVAPDPEQQKRFEAAGELLKKAKGQIGIVVRDRKTGAEWRGGQTGQAIWAGSTIKLAMAANLLERGRTAEIKLDTVARKQIADMLDVSSDTAADALWDKYGKDALVPSFQQQYGMTGLAFAGTGRRWSDLKCTTDDLGKLMSYVLDRGDPADRDYLIAAMRRVGANQRWGVWAAGDDKQPGVKNGWALEVDDKAKHWVTNSVGFAGPEAQYVVAVTFDQPAGAQLGTGVRTVSDLVATALGAKVPAQVTVPQPAGR